MGGRYSEQPRYDVIIRYGFVFFVVSSFLCVVGGLGAGPGVCAGCRVLVCPTSLVFFGASQLAGLRAVCCVSWVCICGCSLVLLSPLEETGFAFGVFVWRARAWACWLRLLLHTARVLSPKTPTLACSPLVCACGSDLVASWISRGSQRVSAARVRALSLFVCFASAWCACVSRVLALLFVVFFVVSSFLCVVGGPGGCIRRSVLVLVCFTAW